jgi:hypothetical protein
MKEDRAKSWNVEQVIKLKEFSFVFAFLDFAPRSYRIYYLFPLELGE